MDNLTIEEKKTWLTEKTGRGMMDGIDDATVNFYYKCMHGYGMSLSDADRYAWLNTLFGYDIGAEKARVIDNWYYMNGLDVMEIEAVSKGTVQSICEGELGLNLDFSKWPEKTPDVIRCA